MTPAFYAYRSNLSYEEALRTQGVLNAEGYFGLLAFESKETITLGRASDMEEELMVSPEFLAERGVELLSTDRGGKCSYHGPGQLVGFPILNLKSIYGDTKAVRRFSEELLLGLAHACAVLGVKSVETRTDFPGVWTARGRLASVGITVKDGYVFHGFSLNVYNSCLSGFGLIRPCDTENGSATCLEQEGVEVESIEELSLKILPYLSVIRGHDILRDSQTVTHDQIQDQLFTMVSRSPMAMEHFHANIQNLGIKEKAQSKLI